jgi:hypothetical protein
MGGMTKLLNRSLKAFVGYTLIVLICSVPVYFWVVESIWVTEIDEQNFRLEERILSHLRKKVDNPYLSDYIDMINNLHPGVTVKKTNADSKNKSFVFDNEKPTQENSEVDRFRGRVTYFELKGERYQIITETNVEEADETILSISLVTLIFIKKNLDAFYENIGSP